MAFLAAVCCLSLSAAASVEPSFNEPKENSSPSGDWESLPDGVQATWASKDIHYQRHRLPSVSQKSDTVVYAWRGERVGLQGLAYAKDGAAGLWSVAATAEGGIADETGWLRYVITDDFNSCGTHPVGLQPFTVAEVLDTGAEIVLEACEVRPFYVALEVPRDAQPGEYSVEVSISNGAGTKTLTARVQVLDRTLPEPADYSYHLDLWQQPYSVSRYYGVQPWSEAHKELLKPYMRRLARAGQKVVTAILFYEPWGEQSNDKFQPMVETVKKADGTWEYRYGVFDEWVELMAGCGIDSQINCFSMVPWDMSFRYWDERTSSYKFLKTTTSAAEYKELWTSFLKAFAEHLREKGWFDKTCIAMDERGLGDMLNAYEIAQAAVPGIKMSLAGNRHSELTAKLHDYCIAYGQFFTPAELAQRRAAGRISTMYTCCTNAHPGLFTHSDPVDAAFIAPYCAANGFDGFLHWSWINWTDNPMEDTRFKLFAPGDTYFFYPGDRPSLRHERLLEGIQQYEKITILRKEWKAAGESGKLSELEAALEAMAGGPDSYAAGVAYQVNLLEAILNSAPKPVLSADDYCTPSLSADKKDIAVAKRWITEATTTGALENLSYSAAGPSADGIVVADGAVAVEPGGKFTLKLKTATNDDDMRYCRMRIYADWDGNKIFSQEELVASVGNPNQANNTLLDYSKSISVPSSANGGLSRLRIVYADAWVDMPTACGSLYKGFAFDIPLHISSPTGVGNVVAGGSFIVEGTVLRLPERARVCIYDTAGHLVDETAPVDSYNLSTLSPGIYAIRAVAGEGREYRTVFAR